jgi:DNA polymerase I
VYFTRAYKNPDGLPYVSAAKQRQKRGLNFTPGMKVGYLVIDGNSSPMSVVDWHEDETGEIQTDFDPEYYAKRIATAMGRITEVFGWNEKELLQGSKQGTLDSWM